MNTKTEQAEALIARADKITIIDDMQFRYPVDTADLNDWTAENGAIDTPEKYQKFCDDVQNVGDFAGLVGSREMIDLCQSLQDAGADIKVIA